MLGVRALGVTGLLALAGCGTRTALLAYAPAADAASDGALDAALDAKADATPDAAPDAADAKADACEVARTQACASWSLAAPIVLDVPMVAAPKLRALAGDCGGAWLLVDGRARDDGTPLTAIVRLDLDGRIAKDPKVFTTPARAGATLAVDFVSKRAAAFADGVSGGYGFMRLDAPPFPSGTFAPVSIASGFSLAGVTHGAAGPSGFSFLSEEVRALWGLERVAVSLDGAFRDRRVLAVPADVGLSGTPVFDRVAYDDGAYTLVWLDRKGGARRAAYYDPSEAPTAATTLRAATDTSLDLGQATAADGFVDVYRTAPGAESATLDFHARGGALVRRATKPAGFATTLHGMSMTFTRGALLMFAEGGSGVSRVELQAYAYAADALAPAVGQRLTSGLAISKATAAGPGALVVGDDGAGALWSAAATCP
jgi:hypothetical protein